MSANGTDPALGEYQRLRLSAKSLLMCEKVLPESTIALVSSESTLHFVNETSRPAGRAPKTDGTSVGFVGVPREAGVVDLFSV